jgi:hypothetical protein
MYEAFDDFRILSGDPGPGEAPVLTAIVRNEMYFLPAFLAHYRRLGVRRFVMLDDRSDDGSRAFLAAQPDVTLLESGRRYGDIVTAAAGPFAGAPQKMETIWRSLLMRRFCAGRWALHLDADEFLVLPEGLAVPDLIALAAAGRARAVTSVMLDMYPADIAAMRATAPFDPDDPGWLFDAVPHLAPAPGSRYGLRLVYPGSRARLMRRFGVLPPPSLRQRLAEWAGRRPQPEYNRIFKTVLMRWQEGDAFLSGHSTTAAPDPRILLPLRHYKFTPDLWRRTAAAVAEKQHYQGSREYTEMERLLLGMEAAGGRFRWRRSRPGHRAAAYAASGNLILPPAPGRGGPA